MLVFDLTLKTGKPVSSGTLRYPGSDISIAGKSIAQLDSLFTIIQIAKKTIAKFSQLCRISVVYGVIYYETQCRKPLLGQYRQYRQSI